LAALTAAGSKLEFVIARRAPERPGKGVVFVTPLKGAKQVKAAEAAGFLRTGSLHSVRVEGTDQPGLGAKMSGALSEAGINLRGLSAAAIGTKFVCYLALDTAEDARKATNTLEKLA
jgi:predicted amino acid-binding ACT domain protein